MLLQFIKEIKKKVAFKKHFSERKTLLAGERFKCKWEDRYPCLFDNTATTSFDAHYLYHTAWAARILAKNVPHKHLDIGSCLRFVSIVSAFIPVEFYDYRPTKITLSGLKAGGADLLSLPFAEGTISSLSCMHVVEHIGLERYGDAFAPEGDLQAMAELERVLSKKGTLLFVVPIGEEARIQYNAHRIYTYEQIISYFPSCSLKSFSLILDNGKFIDRASQKDTCGQKYACGCFEIVKF